MDSPLLASETDRDDDSGRLVRSSLLPSSSAATQHVLLQQQPEDREDETEFSRLIAQRATVTAPPGATEADFAGNWSHHLDASSPFTPSLHTSRIFAGIAPPSSPDRRRPRKGQEQHGLCVRGRWEIVTASTCTVLFVGFAFSSYVSPAWRQSLLQIQSPLLRSGIALATVNLTTWMQQLSSSSWILTVLLPVVILVLPCCFMILAPSWILVDGQAYHIINIEQRILHSSRVRMRLELGMRWCLLVIYLTVFQDSIGMNQQWTGSESTFRIRNQNLGGWASFLLACLCALIVIAVLRLPPQSIAEPQSDVADSSKRKPAPASIIQNDPCLPSTRPGRLQLQQLRTPPRHAFQHATRGRGHSSRNGRNSQAAHSNLNDDDEVNMLPLEESPPVSPRPANDPRQSPSPPTPPLPPDHSSNSSTSTPELIEESDTSIHAARQEVRARGRQEPVCSGPPRRPVVSPCLKILAFETGLLTIVMWMPIFYTPWLSIRVEGTWWESKAVLNWYDVLVSNAWTQGAQAGTDPWILALLAAATILQLVVLPLVASALGILTWLGEARWRESSRRWLYCVQPMLAGPVASMALLLLVFTLSIVSSQGVSSGVNTLGGALLANLGICQQLEMRDELEGACAIALRVRMLTGSWFFIAHSVLLEGFVDVTLRWSLP